MKAPFSSIPLFELGNIVAKNLRWSSTAASISRIRKIEIILTNATEDHNPN